MLFEMKRGIALALLATGCWRTSPPPATEAEPQRPLVQEQAPGFSSSRHHAARPAPQRPSGSSAADALAKLDEFADDMCACADRTCVDGVTQEITQWSQEMKDEYKDVKPTDAETAQATRSMERLSKCMTAAMSAGPPLAPGTP